MAARSQRRSTATEDPAAEARREADALRLEIERLRAALRTRERYLDDADGFVAIDAGLTVVYVNAAAERLLGRTAREVLGRRPWEVVTALRSTPLETACRDVRATGGSEVFSVQLPGGRWFEVRILPGAEGQLHAFFRDVSRQRRAEDDLAESEARFRATFEQAAVGIGHLDLSGRWLRLNQRLCDLLGYTHGELVQRSFQDVTHPDDLEADVGLYRHLLAGDIPTYRIEKRYLRKDGSWVWAELTASLVRDARGDPRYFVAVVADVSDRRRAYQALRHSEERLAAALNASGTGTFHYDLRTGRLEWDASLARLFGLDSPEVVRTVDDFLQRVHPDDRARVVRSVERSLTEGSDYDETFRIVRPDGSPRWITDTASVFFDADGSPLYMTGACVDTTSRREAEEAIRESERWLRFLAENVPQVVWTADRDGRFDYLNERWEAVTGRPPAQDLGWTWTEAVHEADRDRCLEAWRGAIARTSAFEVEVRLLAADGEAKWHLMRGEPLRDEEGAVRTWFGTCTDVDQAHRARDEREQLVAELQNAVAARDEFLSVASHELRTPLTTLALVADAFGAAARRGAAEDPARLAGKAAKLRRQVDRLERLVDTLLGVSRIMGGRLDLAPSEVRLSELVLEVAEALEHERSREGSELELKLDRAVIGRWDRRQLFRVVEHLLANAIRFGGGAPIRVEVSPGEGEALLEVVDHGIGIDAADQARIFDRFEKAVSVRNYGGLGLGLWVTRRVVELMGGRVELTSSPGAGSRFLVRLPLETAA